MTEPSPSDAQADAVRDFAKATNRLATAIEGFKPAADSLSKTMASFTPAAETIHGFGGRLDALCVWLKGKWPWLGLIGYLLLSRVVEKPEDLVNLVSALKPLLPAGSP